jgi:hypothetical protein
MSAVADPKEGRDVLITVKDQHVTEAIHVNPRLVDCRIAI